MNARRICHKGNGFALSTYFECGEVYLSRGIVVIKINLPW